MAFPFDLGINCMAERAFAIGVECPECENDAMERAHAKFSIVGQGVAKLATAARLRCPLLLDNTHVIGLPRGGLIRSSRFRSDRELFGHFRFEAVSQATNRLDEGCAIPQLLA